MATVDTSSLTSSLGSSTGTASLAGAVDKTAMGKQDFLMLLTTQLRYQDPMSPQDPKDFVAQLAQFSSLEQLLNINKGVENLATIGTSIENSMQTSQANSLVGKTVKATGNTLKVTSSSADTAYFNLAQDATEVSVGIYNVGGQLVRTVSLGALAAGDQTLKWDAKNSSGATVADGSYTFRVVAKNASGQDIAATTYVEGIVTGVKSTSQGVYLTINGRQVPLESVISTG